MLSIFETDASFANVFLRLGLVVTFFAHGTQHVFGWHGGKGLKDQLDNWKEKYHIPVPIGIIGMITEMVAIISLTLGFLVRPAVFFLAIFIVVALWKAHWSNGFFLAQKHGRGTGIEYTLALLLMALALLVGGAGALSIDGLISR